MDILHFAEHMPETIRQRAVKRVFRPGEALMRKGEPVTHVYLLTSGVYVTTNQAMANSQAKEVDLLVTWLFTLTQDYYNYKMASVLGIVIFIICAVFTLVAFNKVTGANGEGDYS